jgi:16S rRNA (guanine966-N2)-methyltransferase
MIRISGGEWKGHPLKSPKGSETRPTSAFLRESIFNTLQNAMGLEPRSVLDLFAGTGALGIEALSRGAEKAVFVESSPQTCKVLEQNLQALAQDRSTRVLREADPKKWGKLLLSLESHLPFDLVFCDPPYNKGWILKAFRALETFSLMSDRCILVAEMSPKESLDLENWKLLKDKIHGDSKVVFLERKA